MDRETLLTQYHILKQRNQIRRIEYYKNAILYPRRILEFGKYYFPDVFFLDSFCDLHKYMVDNHNKPMLAVHAPRGHAKSTFMCFLVPIWEGIFWDSLKLPYFHNLIVMASADGAVTQNKDIRTAFDRFWA